MKDKCDNHCETCPMQTQIHCALVYAKATNASVGVLAERIDTMERRLSAEQPALLTPMPQEDSAKLPAQEQGEIINPQPIL